MSSVRKSENGKVKTESGTSLSSLILNLLSYRLVREQRMQDKAEGFASLSSVRQTKYGRSSYRLVREQRMLATITINL
ncbi:MAG: hypothetical protein II314_02840 [Prevotella sp.]|nr:hypothetical protein [Prevotella sp.]